MIVFLLVVSSWNRLLRVVVVGGIVVRRCSGRGSGGWLEW